jgi:hypothetical protein
VARLSDEGLAISVARVLVNSVNASVAASVITARYHLRGADALAMNAAITVTMAYPPPATGVSGPATLAIARMNYMRRAQFVVSAYHRLDQDILAARSNGSSIPAALAAGVDNERKYYGQHLDAMWNRAKAAAQTDSTALTYGDLIGWNTVIDARTSTECRAADRHNYHASDMPVIGYPGAVHPHCRCFPGPPFDGGKELASLRGRAA